MDFATALEKGISLGRRRALGFAASVSALALLATAVSWQVPELGVEYAFIALVVAIGIWPLALSGTKGSQALAQLRGAQPDHWLASSSHGVLVVAGDALIAGDLRVELNPNSSKRRLSAIAYDDSDHSMLIALALVRHDHHGALQEDQARLDVKLDPSVTAERASAFARHALELTQR